MNIPQFVEERLRRPIPIYQYVIKNSTPVLSFGDSGTARVATLGLNPSRIEFLNDNGEELTGALRRLETLTSLEVSSLTEAPSEKLAQVIQSCNSYFFNKPYWRWFGQLEPILATLNASYLKGTACHLDLIQWATDPVWGKIKDASIRKKMITEDAHFLHQQLKASSIDLLLLNGKSVIDTIQKTDDLVLHQHSKMPATKSVQTKLLFGSGPHKIPVIGWTTNIQSSFGVSNELRQMIADEVHILYNKINT